MIPAAPGSTVRSSARRPSLLLASSASRVALALLVVAFIWLTTGWAMGWW